MYNSRLTTPCIELWGFLTERGRNLLDWTHVAIDHDRPLKFFDIVRSKEESIVQIARYFALNVDGETVDRFLAMDEFQPEAFEAILNRDLGIRESLHEFNVKREHFDDDVTVDFATATDVYRTRDGTLVEAPTFTCFVRGPNVYIATEHFFLDAADTRVYFCSSGKSTGVLAHDLAYDTKHVNSREIIDVVARLPARPRRERLPEYTHVISNWLLARSDCEAFAHEF